MKRKYLRELWGLRFDKMLQLESTAVHDYEQLLEECRSYAAGHAIESHLERLIADEKRHVKLAQELLSILKRQPT